RVVNGNQRRRARRPLTAFGVRRSAFWVLGSLGSGFRVLGSGFGVLGSRSAVLVHRFPPNAERRTRSQNYQGICRLVNSRPSCAARSLAGPIITPSLIMSTTLSAFIELRKKIFAAFVAPNTFARAACICGGIGPGPFLTPSENDMSPGPHSAKPTPGTFAF